MSLGRALDQSLGFLSQYMHMACPPHPDTFDQIEAYTDLPVAEMFPPPPVDPAIQVGRALPWLGCRRELLQMPSAHRCLHPDYADRHATDYRNNHTLWARRISPIRRRNQDLMIYAHGWMTPGAKVEELALMPWANRHFGADIIHLDLPFHARRQPSGSLVQGSYYWTADLVRTVEAVRQSVMDIRTLVRWARQQGYRRVGVAGVSLGGVLTMLTACAEPDLDFACPIVAHTNLSAALESAPILAAMRRDLTRSNVSLVQVTDLMNRVGFNRYPLAMEKHRMLIVAAVDDVYLEPEYVLADWERWGQPPIHWIGGGHMMIFPNMIPVWLRLSKLIHAVSPLHGESRARSTAR